MKTKIFLDYVVAVNLHTEQKMDILITKHIKIIFNAM